MNEIALAVDLALAAMRRAWIGRKEVSRRSSAPLSFAAWWCASALIGRGRISSVRALARHTGISRRQVARFLNEFAASGFIVEEEGGGWRVTDHGRESGEILMKRFVDQISDPELELISAVVLDELRRRDVAGFRCRLCADETCDGCELVTNAPVVGL